MEPSKDALEREKEWHEQGFYVDSGHWTSHPFFASRERHWLHNMVQKIRFYGYLDRFSKSKPYARKAKMLLAPAGDGSDVYFLQGLFSEVHGIDISPLALARCPHNVITKEADISESGYSEASFDIIVCSQFLHHVHEIGFDRFIKEFHRILRPGGILAILEPSALHPINQATALASRVLGNVTSKVDGERPIHPPSLTRCLHQNGFHQVKIRGLLFTHVRVPSFLQSFTNTVDAPFRALWPFRNCANAVGWYAEKSES